MDSEIWDTELPYAQHQLDLNHDHPTEGTNPATKAPTCARGDEPQLIAGPLTEQPSMSESTCTSQIVQDVADLERILQQETSLLKPAHRTVIQPPPMTT